MRLTIVIPALNEEDAIGSTIERCLQARDVIIANSPVRHVEIVVVNDGSSDRTAAIAAGFEDVSLINFETNRGYGAAIKEGFEAATGELVGFLDGDGTCDPAFFATLCSALIDEKASVAIGSRMGPDSKMPAIRRLGNRAYALILSVLSNQVVTDTASGMRVIRREVLNQLYPLPDGLHFTPAMSARVLMDDRLTIVERPMPYEERIGESKLRVVEDGVRFLHTILEMTLMWRPVKLFVSLAMLSLALMTLVAGHPIEMWLRIGRLDEDMIYRLLFCSLLGAVGVTLLSAGVLSDNLHRLLRASPSRPTFALAVLDRAYTFRGFCIAGGLATPVLVWLIGNGVWTWLNAGFVAEHWSRVVVAGLIVFALVQMLITVMITNVLRFHAARRSLAGHSAAAVRMSVPAAEVQVTGARLAGRPEPSPAEAAFAPK